MAGVLTIGKRCFAACAQRMHNAFKNNTEEPRSLSGQVLKAQLEYYLNSTAVKEPRRGGSARDEPQPSALTVTLELELDSYNTLFVAYLDICEAGKLCFGKGNDSP